MAGVRVFRNRGAVLIVVLGILFVLTLLATTFANLQQLERSISRNYLDMVRAKLIAMSGVEDATQRITTQLETSGVFGRSGAMEARVARFYGDDIDELGTRADLLNVPLNFAKNPSYAVERDLDPLNPANPQPRPVTLVGPAGKRLQAGFSGAMSAGTYALNGDLYSLRVTDLQGLIHVNDGVEYGPNHGVSQNLKRVLDNLGKVVGVPRLGERILAARPAGGYRAKEELLAAVNYDAQQFEKFRAFVTVLAWQDAKVCNPVPLSSEVLSEYGGVTYYRGSPEVYRYGRGRDAWSAPLADPLSFAPLQPWTSGSIAIFGYDELNPQWIEVVTRAPINVNAAPREVLVAVLEGLKGFFSVERRRNEPPANDNVYNWYKLSYSYRPTAFGSRGGELAYLYTTVPIQGPATGTGAQNNWAGMIADEILACREGRKSPNIPNLDYATAPFGGPFASWRQFSLFCDRLSDTTAGGFLVDDRDHYRDYHPISRSPVASAIQKLYASRALSDVLKANFNPNLHLNETNPESQLWQRVDKTDLVVHSTEFCFTSMGYYEIESIGRVLRPRDGATDALLSGENEILAEKKVTAVLKLFDVYRDTHQADFTRGKLSRRYGPPATNNNQSLELGPEPDSGLGPSENEWSGYIALPTLGGHEETPGPPKPAKTLGRTPQGASEWGSQMHAHFTYDGRLHHHSAGATYVAELGSETVNGEFMENAPDLLPSGLGPGPYTPLSTGGNAHRLARSFKMPVRGTTASQPVLSPMAPLDLRLDGIYLERHCSIGYWLDATTMGASIGQSQGVVAFWMKPAFLPEMTGKPRQILSADRLHSSQSDPPLPPGLVMSYFQPSPFCLWFLPSHDASPGGSPPSESAAPMYNPGYPWGVQPMRTCSMAFGYGYSQTTGYGRGTIAEGGFVTPSLNHDSHADAGVRRSLLRGHRWTHVTATWRTANKEDCSIYVNGQGFPGQNTAWYRYYFPNSTVPWYTHDTGERNTIRFGAPSKFLRTPIQSYQRNWPADITIDEFYWWNQRDRLDEALTLARLGRFYKPINNDYEEGGFTSEEIRWAGTGRGLPPPSGKSSASAPAAALDKQVRLLGAQWTFYGEEAEAQGERWGEVIHDYGPADADLPAECEFSIGLGQATYGPFRDPGFSRLVDSQGKPIVLDGPFTYRIKFRIHGLTLDSQLLATPILDDVTIFYQVGPPEFLRYVIE